MSDVVAIDRTTAAAIVATQPKTGAIRRGAGRTRRRHVGGIRLRRGRERGTGHRRTTRRGGSARRGGGERAQDALRADRRQGPGLEIG